MKLTILGAPRTKKNHNQGVRTGRMCPACRKRAGPIQVFPSKQWREWVKDAAIQIDGAWLVRAGTLLLLEERRVVLAGGIVSDNALARPWQPLAEPVNCAAVFYRDADRGDLIGYMQGLADLLEGRGVVEDDKWIQGWDGSRLSVTEGRPRVELELTPLTRS